MYIYIYMYMYIYIYISSSSPPCSVAGNCLSRHIYICTGIQSKHPCLWQPLDSRGSLRRASIHTRFCHSVVMAAGAPTLPDNQSLGQTDIPAIHHTEGFPTSALSSPRVQGPTSVAESPASDLSPAPEAWWPLRPGLGVSTHTLEWQRRLPCASDSPQ